MQELFRSLNGISKAWHEKGRPALRLTGLESVLLPWVPSASQSIPALESLSNTRDFYLLRLRLATATFTFTGATGTS